MNNLSKFRAWTSTNCKWQQPRLICILFIYFYLTWSVGGTDPLWKQMSESACLAVSSYVMPLLKQVSPPTKHYVTLLGGSHNRDRAVIQDFNLEANSHQLQSTAPGCFSKPHARYKSLWQTTVGIVHVVKNLKGPYRGYSCLLIVIYWRNLWNWSVGETKRCWLCYY